MYRKIVIIIVFLLAGCCGTKSIPVGLDKTIEGLEKDLKNVGYISFSDFLSDNAATANAVNEYVKKKQCLFGRPNPMVILAIDKMNLNLKGVVSADGSFKIAAVPTTTVGVEAGFKMAEGKEQSISWPVTPISLGSLPDLYYESMLKILCEMKVTTELKMDQSDIKKLIEDIKNKREKIKTKIDNLQNGFNAATCGK